MPQPQVPVSPIEQPIPKKSFPLKWLIIIALLAGIVLTGTYLIFKSQSAKQTPPQSTQPSLPSTPTPTPDETANWKTYTSGQNIDGISINYPRGWQVNYKKEYNLWFDYRAKYRLVFDFAPPEWKSPCGENATYMCWGIMSFDIYDFQTDVNQFITKAYPDYKDKLVVAKNIEIGGRPTFLLEGKEDFYWNPRNIVLGSDYSYETNYGQDGYVSEDGKVNYIDILKAKIFSQIYIK